VGGTHVDTYHLYQVAGGMCRFCVYKNISNFVELFFTAKKSHPTPHPTLLRSFTRIAIYCYCCREYSICCFLLVKNISNFVELFFATKKMTSYPASTLLRSFIQFGGYYCRDWQQYPPMQPTLFCI
jgi:hypothetical protein